MLVPNSMSTTPSTLMTGAIRSRTESLRIFRLASGRKKGLGGRMRQKKPTPTSKSFSIFGNHPLAREEDDDVVFGLDHVRVFLGDDGFARPDDADDARTLRQLDLADAPADHARVLLVPVGDEFQRLRPAAAHAVHGHHVAAAHILEERAEGREGGRDRDVDLPALHEVAVGAAIDEGDHAPRSHALGQQRRHDVRLVVVGDGHEEVHLVDVLVGEEVLVAHVAVEHESGAELAGEELAALLGGLDHLHVEVALQRPREPQADVAAARDDHALDRAVRLAHVAHHRADVLGSGDEEDLVSRLHDGVGRELERPVVPVDGGHLHVDVGKHALEVAQRVAHDGAALDGPHGHEVDLAVGELHDLERLGKLDQPLDVLRHDLLGAEGVGHREALVAEELRVRLEPGRADPRDPRRDVEDGVPHLAGHEVRLVARRHREEHVGIGRARFGEDLRLRGVSGDGAKVELAREVLQPLGARVDDGDVVLLGDEAAGHARADLAGAQDEDLQFLAAFLRVRAPILRRSLPGPARGYREAMSFTARARRNTANAFFRWPTGRRCASRAPQGATKTLVTEIPTSAGR